MVGHETVAPTARAAVVPMVAAVAPLLATFLASLWVVLGWAAGASPFWPGPPLTLSEAAGVGNAGEVVRLITIEHHDPNRAWFVREGILGVAQTVTPLEAAVTIRRAELVRVLLRHGVVVPEAGSARAALICRAVAADASDIVELFLASGDRSDPRASCPQPST